MVFNEGHALVIGVGSHKFHPEHNVPITFRDGKAMREILIDPATCAYPPEQTKFLHDASATEDDIVKALEDLANEVTDQDTVFIFFAGHGAFGTDDNYYLATHDVEFVKESGKPLQIKAGTGLSQVKLVELLQKIKAEKVLMIFNACHSGKLQLGNLAGEDEDEGEGQSLPDVTASALLGTGEGRIVISACKPDQLSRFRTDLVDNRTFFTEALEEGLQGKAASDGIISAFNLYAYVYKDVTETIKPYNKKQDPMITVLQTVGLFPVALASGATMGALGEEIEEGTLPEGAVVRRVTPEESEKWLKKIENQTIVKGDYVGGDQKKAGRDIIEQHINADGGVFMGTVTAEEIVARDKIVNEGDDINVGDISGSAGVAIGRGAQASVGGQAPPAMSPAQLRVVLRGILSGDDFTKGELQGVAMVFGLKLDVAGDEDQPSIAKALVKAADDAGKLEALKNQVVMMKPDAPDVKDLLE